MLPQSTVPSDSHSKIGFMCEIWSSCALTNFFTLEILGIFVGSMVLLFLVVGTVFHVSSLCERWSLWSLWSVTKDTGKGYFTTDHH